MHEGDHHYEPDEETRFHRSVCCVKGYGLKQLLLLFEQKYEDINFNPEFVLKSLTYFEDAEDDPMPEMLAPIMRKEVKDFFRREAPRLR